MWGHLHRALLLITPIFDRLFKTSPFSNHRISAALRHRNRSRRQNKARFHQQSSAVRALVSSARERALDSRGEHAQSCYRRMHTVCGRAHVSIICRLTNWRHSVFTFPAKFDTVLDLLPTAVAYSSFIKKSSSIHYTLNWRNTTNARCFDNTYQNNNSATISYA